MGGEYRRREGEGGKRDLEKKWRGGGEALEVEEKRGKE